MQIIRGSHKIELTSDEIYAAHKEFVSAWMIDTARDIDKVVERLEEEKHNISLQDEELEIRIEALDDAIDIIKAGGTCQDKFKQNYKNNNIDKDLGEDLEY